MTDELDRRLSERFSEIEELLAALEHQRWAHWQSYVHSQCQAQPDGSLLIPAELVERWSRQMATPYDHLTAAEKESDLEQVRRYLPIILDALRSG